MESNKIKDLFENEKALLSGHFLLSSGLHSDTYFQSALVLQYPEMSEMLAQELRLQIKNAGIFVNLVVSPALGGIVIGQCVSKSLGVKSIFCERVNGELVLRRGFTIAPGEKCVIVEDVITTGLSTGEVVKIVKELGGDVVAVACLVNRSAGKADFGVPLFSLLSLEVKTYKPEECPLCKQGIEAVKPGSRKQA